jgi:hypothetical protein
MTEWHCNIYPDDGPYAGKALHLILKFTEVRGPKHEQPW